MTLSTMIWAGVLATAGLALMWWELVDFVLDRIGPLAPSPVEAWVDEGEGDPRSRKGERGGRAGQGGDGREARPGFPSCVSY